MIGGDGERSVSLENPLWSGTTRVAIFMPAGVASGDIAQNYLLEPLSQAAATQLYPKDTLRPSLRCNPSRALRNELVDRMSMSNAAGVLILQDIR